MIRDSIGPSAGSGEAWSAVTGAGRARPERSADKYALTYVVLLDRLEATDVWKRHMQSVQSVDEALEIARLYGSGIKRRRVIAEMLTRRCAGIAYSVPDAPTPARDAGNKYSASFWLRTIRGAECIARLGAGQCLTCGEPLAVTRRESGGAAARTSRILYCSECFADEVADRDAMRDVFARAAVALGHQ